MKLFAIGSSVPYSVAPKTTTMLRTLIVEMKGTKKADERIMEMAHVQEPGVEDNASGVGQQLEMLRATKHLIDTGARPRPRRTMTFMWGNEMTMSTLYKASHPAEYNKIVAAFSNDMVGADLSTTGAVYVLERCRTPPPSTRIRPTYSGTTPPAPTQFLRGPDTHTLWGAGSLSWYPYAGHFLTDLYFESGKLTEQSSTGFDTRVPPQAESLGGRQRRAAVPVEHGHGRRCDRPHPIPALATFFFTDYTYHSSMGTTKALSADRLRDVGFMSGVFAYYRADADVKSAGETIDIVKAAADQRFGWEQDNTTAHFLWALPTPTAHRRPPTRPCTRPSPARATRSARSIGETPTARRVGDRVPAGGHLGARDVRGRRRYRRLTTPTRLPPCRGRGRRERRPSTTPLTCSPPSTSATASIAINGGGAWSPHPRRRPGARCEQLRRRWRHRHALLRRRQYLAHRASRPTPPTRPTRCLPANSSKTVYVQFQDSEGNISDAVSASIKLDTTGPESAIGGVPAGWVNHSVPLTFSGDDGNGSGVDSVEYKIGDGAWTEGSAATVTAEGRTVVACRATDKLGNVGPVTSALISIDTSRPRLTLRLSGPRRHVVRHGGDVKARCAIRPTRLASSRVTLTVQRKNGAKWVEVKSGSATIRATLAHGWRYKAPKTGTYRLRATLAKTATNFAARTTWHTFTVK